MVALAIVTKNERTPSCAPQKEVRIPICAKKKLPKKNIQKKNIQEKTYRSPSSSALGILAKGTTCRIPSCAKKKIQ